MDLADFRLQLRADIKSCTACELHVYGQAVPFTGPSNNKLTVIGEAPGAVEAKEGKPFVGPAGQWLEGWLDNELDLTRADILFLNTVFHRPPENNLAAWPGAFSACRPLFDRAMELAGQFVLVLGVTALHQFRPGARMMDWHGRAFRDQEQRHTFFAAHHPAAVLRDRSLDYTVRTDLRQLAALMRASAFASFWDERCGAHFNPMVRWSDAGWPMCNECVAREATRKRKKVKVAEGQRSLI